MIKHDLIDAVQAEILRRHPGGDISHEIRKSTHTSHPDEETAERLRRLERKLSNITQNMEFIMNRHVQKSLPPWPLKKQGGFR